MRKTEIMDNKYYGKHSPHSQLLTYGCRVNKGPVLDLGCGAGNDCCFFASYGFPVTGVDFSTRAIDMAKNLALEDALSVNFVHQDLMEFEIKKGYYSVILCFNTLMFIGNADRNILIQRMKDGLAPGGMLFLSVMSRDEPGCAELEAEGKLNDGSRILDDGSEGMHFFSEDEVLRAFENFELHHLSKEKTLDTAHGEPHYHSFIIYVGKKLGNHNELSFLE